MKIGVSSYSFSRLVNSGAMSQLDVIPKAKAMGFDCIEFSTFRLPAGDTPLTFAPRVRDAAAQAGLEIVNYTIGADFIKGSGGDWKAEAKRLEDEVRVAQILGCGGMRHDATGGFPADRKGGRGFADALPALAQGCRAVTEFAAGLGIRTMVENHGFFCQDSERVERLVSAVNHPNFGVLVDVGNFLCADEDPSLAVGRLAPSAFHVHFKDFHVKSGMGPNPGQGWFPSRGGNFLRGAIIGHGDAPTTQCLRILKKQGYDGVMSIEFEGVEDPLLGIQIGLDNLRRFAAEV